jgi:cysteinyl-tRNA synthetase
MKGLPEDRKAFDIHGGGNDLMFPHHENELAQSRCAHPEGGFARVWMHNEMLQVEGKKMSKSLGNFFTVRDLLEQGVPGEVIRFVFLSTHYRKPMDWTEKKAKEARKTLEAWYNLVKGVSPGTVFPELVEHLAKDLNTPAAMSFLKTMRYSVVRGEASAPDFLASAQFLGLDIDQLDWARDFRKERMENPNHPGYGDLFEDVDLVYIIKPDGISDPVASEIANWIAMRWAARQKKLFDFADEIKAGLMEAGVELQESKFDVRWEPTADFSIANLPELPAPPKMPGGAE